LRDQLAYRAAESLLVEDPGLREHLAQRLAGGPTALARGLQLRLAHEAAVHEVLAERQPLARAERQSGDRPVLQLDVAHAGAALDAQHAAQPVGLDVLQYVGEPDALEIAGERHGRCGARRGRCSFRAERWIDGLCSFATLLRAAGDAKA